MQMKYIKFRIKDKKWDCMVVYSSVLDIIQFFLMLAGSKKVQINVIKEVAIVYFIVVCMIDEQLFICLVIESL